MPYYAPWSSISRGVWFLFDVDDRNTISYRMECWWRCVPVWMVQAERLSYVQYFFPFETYKYRVTFNCLLMTEYITEIAACRCVVCFSYVWVSDLYIYDLNSSYLRFFWCVCFFFFLRSNIFSSNEPVDVWVLVGRGMVQCYVQTIVSEQWRW